MVIYKGGMHVEKGLYWNPMDGQRVTMEGNGRLPADEDRSFLRISPIALLVVAPLFGMMYVVFLPLFGIAAFMVSWMVPVISALTRFAMTGIRVCGKITGKNHSFNWNPSRAHFSGKARKAKKGKGK